ncbi:MAG: 5-formyltetrahydrofolate cyclo-ligase [Kofleriaceae bacterium]|nr:5-formyltetrahydrofolate cyclo-ligase [Kofleriaceae bacterium]
MSDSTSSGAPSGLPSKRAARQALLARRDGLTAEVRALASLEIAERVNRLVEERLAPGAVLALYAAKGSEVETAAIDRFARSRGLRVVYPRVVHDTKQLVLCEVELGALVATRWGLREPPLEAPVVPASDVAAFVMPGLAFDRAGGRIGWGLGHYDVTLAQNLAALRIALAFECQIVESVASEPHDIAVHFIITEVATHVVA